VIDGQVTPDPDHKLSGRGAWLHPKCFEMAKNRRAFTRAFPVLRNMLDQGAPEIAELEKLEKLENYVLNL
jgi:predicted RNA-binding protein YlxR (DUF448 family)